MVQRRLEIERLGGIVTVEEGHSSWLYWLVDRRLLEPVVKLNLSYLDGYDLTKISCFSQLESLILYDIRVTGEDLQRLSTLPRLRELNLLFTGIEPRDLRHLVELPSLEELRLGPITDDALPYLDGCQKLQVLRIYRSKALTDRGLRRLPALPRLKTLYLLQTKTSSAGKQELEQRFPGLEIIHQNET